MAVIAAPKFKRSVEFCGMAGPVDGVGDGQTCHRLPMHHGEHNPFVRGNGVAKPKPRQSAKKATASKPKTITRGGVAYRLVPVKSAETPEPVVAPTKSDTPSSKTAQKAPAKAAPKPRVRVIPEAKSRRRVASSSGQ